MKKRENGKELYHFQPLFNFNAITLISIGDMDCGFKLSTLTRMHSFAFILVIPYQHENEFSILSNHALIPQAKPHTPVSKYLKNKQTPCHSSFISIQ